MLVILI